MWNELLRVCLCMLGCVDTYVFLFPFVYYMCKTTEVLYCKQISDALLRFSQIPHSPPPLPNIAKRCNSVKGGEGSRREAEPETNTFHDLSEKVLKSLN